MDRRALNEHRRRLFTKNGRAIGYLCECLDPACTTTVALTDAELASIRPGLILAPGHLTGAQPDEPTATVA